MKTLGNLKNYKELEFAFRNLIVKGINLIVGNYGSGKSFFSLYLSLLAKSKRDFEIFEVGNVDEVYYVDGENNYDELNRRACKIKEALGIKEEINYTNKIEDVYNLKNCFIVIDSYLCFKNVDFSKLRDNYTIVLHHLNKIGKIYGSIKIPAFSDCAYLMENTGKYFRLTNLKDRFGKLVKRVSMRLNNYTFELVNGYVSVKISKRLKNMLPEKYNSFFEKLLEGRIEGRISGRIDGRIEGRNIIKLREDIYNKIMSLKSEKESIEEFLEKLIWKEA